MPANVLFYILISFQYSNSLDNNIQVAFRCSKSSQNLFSLVWFIIGDQQSRLIGWNPILAILL